MSFHSFPNAVYNAIGTAVPCLRPYSGIELLQIIPHGHIKPRGSDIWRTLWCFLFPRDSLVLVDPGSSSDTLITLTDNEHIKTDLEKFVHNTRGENNIQVWTMELDELAKAGIELSIENVLESPLISAGVKEIRNTCWKLSIGNDGQVTKWSVPPLQLGKFLDNSNTKWDLQGKSSRVVTAIYKIAGGLTFTGDAMAVTRVGCDLSSTPVDVPVKLTAGWHLIIKSEGGIKVASDSSLEYIIAIDYLELKSSYVVGRQNTNNPPNFAPTNLTESEQADPSPAALTDSPNPGQTTPSPSALTNSPNPGQTTPSSSVPTNPPVTNASQTSGDCGRFQRYLITLAVLTVTPSLLVLARLGCMP